MIVPQPEDISPINALSQDFRARYQNLQTALPSLPLHYPKSRLPTNICEKQLLSIFKCTLFHSLQQEQSCSYQLALFQQCRKIRDINILSSIKNWQADHIRNMDGGNRGMYLQGLGFKLERLKDEYSKVPSTKGKMGKMIQIQSEIEQIKWRIKNIKAVIKEEEQANSKITPANMNTSMDINSMKNKNSTNNNFNNTASSNSNSNKNKNKNKNTNINASQKIF